MRRNGCIIHYTVRKVITVIYTENYRMLKVGTMLNLTGKPAVPFTLHDSAGRSHTLADYAGSWLLMVFHRHLG